MSGADIVPFDHVIRENPAPTYPRRGCVRSNADKMESAAEAIDGPNAILTGLKAMYSFFAIR